MTIPAVPFGMSGDIVRKASSGGGFNPLTMLGGLAGGGMGIPSVSASSSAASDSILEQMINSPFNVGSGAQDAPFDGAQAGHSYPNQAGPVNNEALNLAGLALGVGGGIWLLANALK